MSRVLFIGTHADDEILAAGGCLLKHRAAGADILWLVVATPSAAGRWAKTAGLRRAERDLVAAAFGFKDYQELGYEPGQLDEISFGGLVDRLRASIARLRPDLIYTVWPGDRHSDHQIVGRAVLAAWPPWAGTVKAIRFGETASSTGADFVPDTWVEITDYLARKLDILRIYYTELRTRPHPRNPEAVNALAQWRGNQVGAGAAEAFKTAWAVESTTPD